MADPILGWKIYYSDGTLLTSESNKWASCPSSGVVAIIYYQDCGNGNTTVSKVVGRDFYDFDEEHFYKSDNEKDLPGIAIKTGEFIPDEQYFSKIAEFKTEDSSKWSLSRLTTTDK